jgi:hypothetical protein
MKKTKLKKVPILIQLYPDDVYNADLTKALKIDRHNLSRELLNQPALYGFWTSLYCVVSEKVTLLREQVDQHESFLSREYVRKFGNKNRVGDMRHFIAKDERLVMLKKKLRLWQNSERLLKYAERAFEQRLNVLMAINANKRQDKRIQNYREEDS